MEYTLNNFYNDLREQPHSLLENLIKYSAAPRNRTREEVRLLREEFNEARSMVPLLTAANDCATCGNRGSIHIHHIIPLSCGGGNEMLNLLPLCEKCHALVHPWLQADLSDIKKNIHGILIEYSSAYRELNKEPDPQYGQKISRVRKDIATRIVALFDY